MSIIEKSNRFPFRQSSRPEGVSHVLLPLSAYNVRPKMLLTCCLATVASSRFLLLLLLLLLPPTPGPLPFSTPPPLPPQPGPNRRVQSPKLTPAPPQQNLMASQAFNTTGEGMGAKELAEFLSPQVLPVFPCFFAAKKC